MIWYDPTELSSTNIEPAKLFGMYPLSGLEAATGADYLVVPFEFSGSVNGDTSLEDVLLLCENNKDKNLLVQRKQLGDFYTSLQRLPYIAGKMSMYTHNYILYTTGYIVLGDNGAAVISGRTEHPNSWDSIEGSRLSWQLRYGGIYLHANETTEFIRSLRNMEKRLLSDVKQVYAREPRTGIRVVGKEWSTALLAWDGIGDTWAIRLSEQYNSFPECWQAIVEGRTGLGKAAVMKVRRQAGLE